MALVIDEYGGTDGLASIEDIVELIVGDIEDEHDLDEGPLVSRTDEGAWVVDARAELEEVEALSGLPLSESPDSESVETIGGLVTMIAGRVPSKGSEFLSLKMFNSKFWMPTRAESKKVLIRMTGNKTDPPSVSDK